MKGYWKKLFAPKQRFITEDEIKRVVDGLEWMTDDVDVYIQEEMVRLGVDRQTAINEMYAFNCTTKTLGGPNNLVDSVSVFTQRGTAYRPAVQCVRAVRVT